MRRRKERERAINYDLPNPSGPSPIVITFQYVSLLYTESSGNLSISLASSTIEISSPIIDKDRNVSSDLKNDIKNNCHNTTVSIPFIHSLI